ncbi:MAG: hypothetical protein K9G67_02260 [Bacteroidales bacterium]|nr:hypothetical protein [Bacteroidales bacterium]MCF8375155.1 hypothetical protein [Bacteroidales bacterium]
MKIGKPISLLLLSLLTGTATMLPAQRISRYTTPEMELIYFGDRYSYLMPHVARTFHNSMYFHKDHWDYGHRKTFVMLTDFEDDGHGGAMVLPYNMIVLGVSPFNFAFSIVPSNERFQWLFSHEFTHVTMADKANKTDRFWRKVLLGKVRRDEEAPVSALWSYLTAPRWYAPRWYHEGIACYMETWMSGGMGRALGPYDEMYFRSIANEDEPIYSVIGLETEGSTIDFQVGANAYLYGTRFITYLSQKYGDKKVREFYDRDDDTKAFYAAQFRKVYGKSIHDAWEEWTRFEKAFQQKNLETIKAYPLSPFRPVTDKPLGSFSNVGFRTKDQKIYAAVNHPGDISQIIELDITNGDIRKIAVLDSPMLYSVTYLAYDPKEEQIFITGQNNKYRSLVKVDANTGKKEKLIKMSRTGNLAYNVTDRSLWGVKHDNGYATLVKIPEPYTEIIPMHTTEFGRSLFDLAVSNDGRSISATMTGIRGEQSVILFNIADLEKGIKQYKTILELEDNTLTQFKFSNDDRYLIGTSYYTGVSNIWRISLEDKNFELLSNDETGLFMPVQISEDSLFVLKFQRNGMQPGIIPVRVHEDANAIDYLGDMVVDNSPEVIEYSLQPASKINIDSLKTEEKAYYPFRNMSLSSAYPDIAGFKKTVALGYRMNWRDRIGLSNINLFVAGSPWGPYPDKQRLHLELRWDYWLWNLHAAYNKTNFYDLFGPVRRSRAGYSVGIGHNKNFSRRAPFIWHYGFDVTHYGDLEVLPQFQEIATPIKNFQSFSAMIGMSKLRKTLGGVQDEKGYLWELTGYSYLANGSFYPYLISEQHVGWLVPGIRNTSFWIRNSLGQSYGKQGSSFSSFYFGGFRNNYVDWQQPEQYRKVLAFPGVDIDALEAHNFIKTMGELDLKPIRLRDVGFTWLYPTFIKTSMFGTHLMANPDDDEKRRNVFNAGIQIDLELVLFSYLKTTWSAGYARMFEEGIGPNEQWMFSVKLLGN